MNQIYGFMDIFNKPSNTFTLDEIEHIDYEELMQIKNMNIVICSFSKQKSILQELNDLKNSNKLYLPTRTSKIKSMFFSFRDKEFLTRAFLLKLVK